MGIFRPNLFLIEEFSSPGDPRFRVEMDVRIDHSVWAELQGLLDEGKSKYPRVREILLGKLAEAKARAAARAGAKKRKGPLLDPRAAKVLLAALPGQLRRRRRRRTAKGQPRR